MTSQYTIVQFVPDPTADERMNIGVLTWDNQHVYSNFVGDFSRARKFSGKNVNFLKQFASYVGELTKENSKDYAEFAPNRIPKLISSWTDSIQFTQPRGSTKTASQLIAELPLRFLHAQEEIATATKPSPTRASAIRTAYRCMVDAARSHSSNRKLVRKKLPLRGRFSEHAFDIVFVNGSPFGAVNALSFGLLSQTTLQREIDATAWIFDDVRKRTEDLPLAVFIAHSEDNEKLFKTTMTTFRGLNSDVISQERGMIKWADTILDQKLRRAAAD